MRDIVIAGFDGALATAITGLVDIFSLTGVSWARMTQQAPKREFRVLLASEDGHHVRCLNGLTLKAHCRFDYLVSQTELSPAPYAIIVPTIGGKILDTLQNNQALCALLRWGHSQGSIIAGNCTGNFFLAEAGLLKHRSATTHWGYKGLFEERYPEVDLRINQMITAQDNIYCAGGGLAWFDLCIHLIEAELGYQTAIETARAFVIDYRRDNQLSYSLQDIAQQHQDTLLGEIQHFMRKNLHQRIELDALAQQFNLSQRTLIRRFQQAIGMSPKQYLQALRIEAAQKLIAETDLSTEAIVQSVGYEDSSSFRRLFKARTGSTLKEYRQRFARRI